MPDAAIGDFRIIRWLIGHWDEAQVIFDAIQLAIEAPTLREKIIALHPVLDAIANIVDDFPAGFAAAEDQPELEAQAQSEAAARKIDWAKLLAIAEKILPFVLLFLDKNPNAET